MTSEMPFDGALFEALLGERRCPIGRPLVVLAETTSTNDEARRGARDGAPHGAVWVAERQTSGRGRQGRTWQSANREGLLCSTLLRLECPLARLPSLSLVLGLALRDAVAAELPGAVVQVKWPNDVNVGGKKLGGVLVESSITGRDAATLVVGVGANVHTKRFSPELAPIATSLALAGAAAPSRERLLAELLAGLARDVEAVVVAGLDVVRARLERADALFGQRVRSDSGEGLAAGFDGDGRLLVRRDDGTVDAWVAGDVHLSEAN